MYSSVKPSTPYERVMTTSVKVSCDGGKDPAMGHPLVYLDINPDIGSIVCPYCSREFVLQKGAD